jgi:uncharacterized protein (TIGR02271 family)
MQIPTQLIEAELKNPLDFEHLIEERVPVAADDSGEIETLPDGALSIPLYEEELIVTKRTVLRERVIIRKQIAARTQKVETELRREFVEIDADDGIEVIDQQQPEEETEHGN